MLSMAEVHGLREIERWVGSDGRSEIREEAVILSKLQIMHSNELGSIQKPLTSQRTTSQSQIASALHLKVKTIN